MSTLRGDFEAAALAGEEYLSEWHVITQQMVDDYAALTGDGEGEWVHLDPERAAREPGYDGTIVQGFLQVSHLIKLHAQAMKARPAIDKNFALNYGFDRLRFVGQMPVGARFRARVGARELTQKPGGGLLLKQEIRLELEDGRPTLVADWLFYLDPRAFGEG
jgi:acyl dehydratase